ISTVADRVERPISYPSRPQTMLTVLTQSPRFVSGNWVEATAAGLYPAILEGTLGTLSSRKIPPMRGSKNGCCPACFGSCELIVLALQGAAAGPFIQLTAL